MAMTDKDFAEQIHMEIHALRRIAGYKPSIAEMNISKLVIGRFRESCDECRQRGEQMKQQPQQESFIKKLGGMLTK